MKKVPPPKSNVKRPPPPRVLKPSTNMSQNIQRQQFDNAGPAQQQNINHFPQQNTQNRNQNQGQEAQMSKVGIAKISEKKNQSVNNGITEITQPQTLENQQSEQLQQIKKIPQRQHAKSQISREISNNRFPIPAKKGFNSKPPITNKKAVVSIDIQPATHVLETQSKTGSQKVRGINPNIKKQVPMPQTPQQKQEQQQSKKTNSVYSRLQDKLNKLSNAREQLQMSDSQDQFESEQQVMSQPNAQNQGVVQRQGHQQKNNSQKDSEKQIDQFNENQPTNLGQANQEIVIRKHEYQQQKNVDNFYFDEVQPLCQKQITQDQGLQLDSNFQNTECINNQVIQNLDRQSPIGQPFEQQKTILHHSFSQNLNKSLNNGIILDQQISLNNSKAKRNIKLQRYQPENSIAQQQSQQHNQSIEKSQSAIKRSQTRKINGTNINVKIDEQIKVQEQQSLEYLIANFDSIKKQYSQNMINFKKVCSEHSRQEAEKVERIKILMGQLKGKDQQIRNILMQY